ncbi:MAG: cysteine--tRNA ligase [Geodermatophilaceae bacterium]|nr:cysteine--tRNA ligase [Geodermatophilaceae bacterium]
MSLRLYDTATRGVRDFVPLVSGEVSIYLCGVTVQGAAHIGHARSAVNFDILRRWLEHSGQAVSFVRNGTDIDDKILTKSAEAGVPWWAWAAQHERGLSKAYETVGCRPPTVEPRATGHVPEMIRLMHRLTDSGHAYAAGGDVYFDVASYPPYGELSGQRVDKMLAAADTPSDSAKRDPRDFALWKGARPGEPSWDTPWGPGRPGWHLECSAMAERYLGPSFDIHGGGLDLVFPHHENEQAQSRAVGDGFASYWMHNAWVTLGGEKMSKSLGNSTLVAELVETVRPIELRYYLAGPHYRSTIEYTPDSLAEAAVAFRRIEGFVARAVERVGPHAGTPVLCTDFATAMDDDLGVPAALACIQTAIRAGNTALSGGEDAAVAGALGAVRAMLGVLGLDPLAAPWAGSSEAGLRPVVDSLVQVVLEQRAAARARQDYAGADAIRDQLAAAGIVVEDTASGPRWSVEGAR